MESQDLRVWRATSRSSLTRGRGRWLMLKILNDFPGTRGQRLKEREAQRRCELDAPRQNDIWTLDWFLCV
jgi:hypothetical protein